MSKKYDELVAQIEAIEEEIEALLEAEGASEEFEDEDDPLSLGEEDYGFIFNGEGEIKAVFMPSVERFEIPKQIHAVFKTLGLDNPNDFTIHTVH
jgi:hypothetical protein